MANTERTIVLFGKTGVGKSSSGNTILDMKGFAASLSSSSVTKQCQKQSAVISEKKWTVVDTPDYFYSTHDEDLSSEIERSVDLSPPGVHAFLFVLKPTTFTEQEADIVSKFKLSYGEEAFRYTMIIFTHKDQLDKDIETLISENKSLQKLVICCGGRFHVLNNKNLSDRQQVYQLLEKINNMVSANGNSCYTLEMLQEAERRAEEQCRMESDVQNIELSDQNNKVRRVNVRMKYVCVIALFSLAMGAMLNKGSAGPWIFVLGCVLGGSAASLGVITGKIWTLIGKINTSCSSSQECTNVPQYMKKTFGLLCGGAVGSVLGHMCLGETPVTLLAGLAGAVGTVTAMCRSC